LSPWKELYTIVIMRWKNSKKLEISVLL